MTHPNTDVGTEQVQPEPVAATALTPISASSRIDTMDILRGFALLGILLMNIEWFNRPINQLGNFDFTLTGGDWAAGWLIRLFVEGKFFKLFSILFGMGFAVMLIRAQEAGRPFYAWFTRRMVFLFMFGVAHMVLFWGGDIIHDYAAGGLLVLFWVWLINKFKRLNFFNQPRWFLRIGLGVMALPFLVLSIVAIYFGTTRTEAEILKDNEERIAIAARIEEIKADEALSQELIAEWEKEKADAEAGINPDAKEIADETTGAEDEATSEGDTEVAKAEGEDNTDAKDEKTEAEKLEERARGRFKNLHGRDQTIAEEAEAFTNPSWWVATEYRIKASKNFLLDTPFFATFISFPLFMVGYWFIASGVMRRPKEHIGLFKALMWVGLSVGLVVNAGPLVLMVNPAREFAVEIEAVGVSLFMFGQGFMTAGYIGAIVLMCLTLRGKKMLSWLAPMGRMALTNYIMHSAILSTIFYGYGWAMFGQIQRGSQVGMVVAIILFQAIFSAIWLKFFRFGPLEWLWRSLTYLQFQPMRVEKETPAEAVSSQQ